MVLVHETISTKLSLHTSSGFDATYEGNTGDFWLAGGIPQGGYLLALIIDATTRFQSTTTSPDPIHVTAHYIQSGVCNAPFHINVRVLKKGKLLTNILADFVQQNKLRISAHLMFGTLHAPLPTTPYTRRLPLYRHPSTAPVRGADHYVHTSTLKDYIQLSAEPEIAERNSANSPTRTDEQTYGDGGIYWGGWYTLTHTADKLTPPLYAIFCDILLNRADHDPNADPYANWYPTTTMNIEFKSALPRTSAQRTIGSYSTSSLLLNEPNKRHNTTIELWSAPTNLGEGKEARGWRDEQVCLAVAHQMAMIVPMVSQRPEKRDTKL
ncbi:hypothetical protein CYLTODRAFT_452975 [Cylindrobasidium torrendii FP15055 ss-10]|uniref:Acyl-CoA thioesterase-like N-terminal HotDog domain-containing protein n=1 Tax=Cylindrobasidium torrendii FP15055 ss-10 TaxID=1314674 RepID=A0A0D7BHB7_9AGAR|nr:hypothetical protein CYLTODRAFT_452975 [Cylindrobasidium torrendii FP15055 ss-10]